jgi:hypothetical protein
MQSFPFTTLPNGPFQFNPVLDGINYQAQVVWNLFGQRWYLNLFDGSGNRVTTVAVVESPQFIPIEALSWDSIAQLVTLTTAIPHGLPVGADITQTIRGCSPATYNGVFDMAVTSPTTLTFPLTVDPGALVSLGSFGRDINLVPGYFQTSILCYRGEIFYVYP